MKILMRTNMWPERELSPQEIIAYDKVGSNIGNMLFCYSVARWMLGKGNIEIDNIRDSEITTFKDIDKKYDMLILPFANAFREDFMSFIRQWTKLIKSLSIPCVVIGIGVQAPLNKVDDIHFDFDDDVRAFCEAVLEKSATIGVRGEITKKYLVDCGVEESKIKVIGCPSVFIHGEDFIPLEKKDFKELKPISFNSSQYNVKVPLINRWMEEHPDSWFIPQNTWELVMLYTGYQSVQLKNQYCVQYQNKLFKEGRILAFTDTLSWISYLNRNVGLSVGTRIHGNVAALIAGVPTLIIAPDTRVKEICDFFAIPYLAQSEAKNDMTIEEWYDKTDYKPYNERYFKALEIYKSFWKENKLPYVVPKERVAFLPEEETQVIESCVTLSDEERLLRINQYFTLYQERMNKKDQNRQKQIINLRKKYRDLEKKNSELNDLCKDLEQAADDLKKDNEELEKVKHQYLEAKEAQETLRRMSVGGFAWKKLKQGCRKIIKKDK